MTKQLSEDGKINLVRRNVSEIINEKKISSFLKKGTVYCGYETSGEIHLGHLVTIMKLLDLPSVKEATFLPRDVKRLRP